MPKQTDKTGNFKNCRSKISSCLCVWPVSQSEFLSLSHTHTDAAYSLSLSRPVSHTITPVRRGDNPSQGRGGGGTASWVMSVDTCQKYSLCPEKAVRGVTAVRLPLTLQHPPPTTHPPTHPRLGPADRKASCVPPPPLPRGRKRARESEREPAGRVISTTPRG